MLAASDEGHKNVGSKRRVYSLVGVLSVTIDPQHGGREQLVAHLRVPSGDGSNKLQGMVFNDFTVTPSSLREALDFREAIAGWRLPSILLYRSMSADNAAHDKTKGAQMEAFLDTDGDDFSKVIGTSQSTTAQVSRLAGGM